jgi:TolA-binding protein
MHPLERERGLQSEIEQLKGRIKRVEAEQAMEDIKKEKERRDEKAKQARERGDTAGEPAGSPSPDIPPEEPKSPEVPPPEVKDEGLKREEEERGRKNKTGCCRGREREVRDRRGS